MQQLPHNQAPNRVNPDTQPPNQTTGDSASDYMPKGVKYGDRNEKPKGIHDWGDWTFGYLILAIIAGCLILFLASVIIPDLSDAVIDSIRYFKRLFRRARFYPRLNGELVQLVAWATFIGWALYRIKCVMHRRNNRK